MMERFHIIIQTVYVLVKHARMEVNHRLNHLEFAVVILRSVEQHLELISLLMNILTANAPAQMFVLIILNLLETTAVVTELSAKMVHLLMNTQTANALV